MHLDIPAMKTAMVDGERLPPSFGGHGDLAAHFANFRPDFVGQPELCFAHAQLIVLLRREIDLEQNVPAFLNLWRDEAAFLAKHLNSRWLISACDTFADYGSGFQRATALILAAMINTIKLCETERIALRDPTIVPEKYEIVEDAHRRQTHIELWDGVTAYSCRDGDMPRNLFRRIIATADEDPALGIIARALICRAVEGNNLFGRLAKLNDGFLPPEWGSGAD
ncbi:MAG: hypothetical protein QOJ96_2880 [Alphaproteobacteria bacterium]|jgi:hypothetical protein|nr:hypothetical protein [Alphaproteobacteria bacterium]